MLDGTNNGVVILVRHLTIWYDVVWHYIYYEKLSGDGWASLDGYVLEVLNPGILPWETEA